MVDEFAQTSPQGRGCTEKEYRSGGGKQETAGYGRQKEGYTKAKQRPGQNEAQPFRDLHEAAESIHCIIQSASGVRFSSWRFVDQGLLGQC